MDSMLIEGGTPLKGEIKISGAKNSALKLMAAALLSEQPLTLKNMPDLADTRFMAQLLEHLGLTIAVDRSSAQMQLHAATLTSTFADYDRVRKMRATFNVLGPLLAREGQAKVSLPGGCAIGARPVDLHLEALQKLSAQIELDGGYVIAKARRGLRGAQIAFPFVSVGVTEHLILAACLAQGQTVLDNVAREPEIVDLADCLNAMGANITGAGTSRIEINGVSSLSSHHHHVIGDRIEAGTYALMVAATGGKAKLSGVSPAHLTALIAAMEKTGAAVIEFDNSLLVSAPPDRPLATDIVTQPHPGYPTDLQAQFMAYMAIANGSAMIKETIFENRFMHAPELERMGAQIHVSGNEARVIGVEQLRGAPVMATDLRASSSLVTAALTAKGETKISRLYHLDRGFERLEKKLSACGAKIRRQSD